MRTHWISIIFLLALALGSCGPSQTVVADSPTVPTPKDTESLSTPLTDSPVQGDTTQMTPSVPTPADPNVQRVIEKAKEDLAQRLSISIEQISLVEASAVAWPDASLGCPQLGIAYTQVTTPGYWILLEASGSQYPYHSDRGTQLVLCQEESSPLFPVKPGEIDDGQPWMPP